MHAPEYRVIGYWNMRFLKNFMSYQALLKCKQLKSFYEQVLRKEQIRFKKMGFPLFDKKYLKTVLLWCPNMQINWKKTDHRPRTDHGQGWLLRTAWDKTGNPKLEKSKKQLQRYLKIDWRTDKCDYWGHYLIHNKSNITACHKSQNDLLTRKQIWDIMFALCLTFSREWDLKF